MTPVERAAVLLGDARAPLMLIGSGARRAMAQVELLRGRLQAPILTTPEAKSQVDEARPEAGGVFSFGAGPRANALVDAADVILALGTELGEFASRGGRAFHGKAVIQVVADAREVATTLTPDVVVVTELAAAAAALAMLVARRPAARPWFAAVNADAVLPRSERARCAPGMLDPAQAIGAIAASLPARARLACDVTSATLMLLRDVSLGPDQRLWCNLEKSACMGGALPAGLGLRLASGLPTVVLIGDWGLMMGSSELHTVASLQLSGFALVVWSNAGGALIRCGVKAQGIEVADELHTWRTPTSFTRVARGYGLAAARVRTVAGLRRTLGRALGGGRPTLIEAMIDPHAEVPAGDRYLHLDASREERT